MKNFDEMFDWAIDGVLDSVAKSVKENFKTELSVDELKERIDYEAGSPFSALDMWIYPFSKYIMLGNSYVGINISWGLKSPAPELFTTDGNDLFVNISGGCCDMKDRKRIDELIYQLEDKLGETLVFNDINDVDGLILGFAYHADERLSVEQAISKSVNKLMGDETRKITEELLSLCSK